MLFKQKKKLFPNPKISIEILNRKLKPFQFFQGRIKKTKKKKKKKKKSNNNRLNKIWLWYIEFSFSNPKKNQILFSSVVLFNSHRSPG